ncbi:glycoprotein-N-acetylgalactosamine 3-beta-galactosyltransferase 1-like [Haliotis cracherodii]|uniref:glycoprotein-N-acetylgalactosamine 3-beta-galactosyltransferase 1-like n=1 Tax=Haliotis cracherodii TaxID=6455 RepID=UPI0039E8C643
MKYTGLHLLLAFCCGLMFSHVFLSHPLLQTQTRIRVEEDCTDVVSLHQTGSDIRNVLRENRRTVPEVDAYDVEERRDISKIKVLCWIMTAPKNLKTKAQYVKETWGKRCDKLLFYSSTTDESFPTIGLGTPEGRQHLTAKTMQAFRHLYTNYLKEADWFLKADDDTYVLADNLKYFLSKQNKNEAVYFGNHFKNYIPEGYNSGGAGYVVSYEALKRFGERGNNSDLCSQDGGAEDAEFGKCLVNLGAKVGRSLDEEGKTTFHAYHPLTHMSGSYPQWVKAHTMHGARKGAGNISSLPITFHYVRGNEMLALDFYIYHVKHVSAE